MKKKRRKSFDKVKVEYKKPTKKKPETWEDIIISEPKTPTEEIPTDSLEETSVLAIRRPAEKSHIINPFLSAQQLTHNRTLDLQFLSEIPLDVLNNYQRDILKLYFEDEWSTQDIADHNKPPRDKSTIYRRIVKAVEAYQIYTPCGEFSYDIKRDKYLRRNEFEDIFREAQKRPAKRGRTRFPRK